MWLDTGYEGDDESSATRGARLRFRGWEKRFRRRRSGVTFSGPEIANRLHHETRMKVP